MTAGCFFDQPYETLIWSGILIAEFFLVVFLGFLFLQLLTWEARFSQNRQRWLNELERGRRILRKTRRQFAGLEKRFEPALLLPRYGWVRKLMWVRLIFRVMTTRKAAART